MKRRSFLGAVPLLATTAAAAAVPGLQWSVITIGNLSRNRYWGEPDDKPFRAVLCTCTLISGEGFRLLVDPSCPARDEMARELNRRTGLKLDDITAIFITHEHADHVAGLEHFPKAAWWAGAPVAQILNADKKFTRRIEAAPLTLFGSVEVIPTPGHTLGHHSLRFDSGGRSIVVAGDAVATADFWRERRSFYNAVDPVLARKTMDRLAQIAAIVIPGHDNLILV
jgi:glyoxylase-like metal-dependent hydrolase (beta-lactamase superfamily II)